MQKKGEQVSCQNLAESFSQVVVPLSGLYACFSICFPFICWINFFHAVLYASWHGFLVCGAVANVVVIFQNCHRPGIWTPGHGHGHTLPLHTQAGWAEQGTEHRVKAAESWLPCSAAHVQTPKGTLLWKTFHGVNYPEQLIHFIDYKKLFSIDMAFLLLMQVCLCLNRGPGKRKFFPWAEEPIYLRPWKQALIFWSQQGIN